MTTSGEGGRALDDLATRIAARRADPEFTARLDATMQQNRRALERLAEGDGTADRFDEEEA